MNKPASILIVDDDTGVRFYLQEALTRDGHEVVAVDSGEAALRKMAEQEFDLALLDLRLKEIDGMEVLRTMRQMSPDTIPIVLTGHGSLETAVEALRQGAHDYLFKPCKTIALRESIRGGLLKRRQHLEIQQLKLQAKIATPNAASGEGVNEKVLTSDIDGVDGRFLHQGNLVVDLMRHLITMNGHLLDLTPTEFDLLAYLISEAPRAISNQELVHAVQGYDTDLVEARDIIRYHIYRIRKKVRAIGIHVDIFRTVRGIGYTINE